MHIYIKLTLNTPKNFFKQDELKSIYFLFLSLSNLIYLLDLKQKTLKVARTRWILDLNAFISLIYKYCKFYLSLYTTPLSQT